MTEKINYRIGSLNIPARIDEIFEENFDNHYRVYYKRNTPSLLNELCDKYGSDKGEIKKEGHPYPWPAHTYADFIERHFGHCREFIKKVFECGIGSNDQTMPSNMTASGRPGASLRTWRDYFPEAQIYGADIDNKILFDEERIKTFHCDQTSESSIKNLWSSIGDVQFDLMIDDGLHTFEAGRTLLLNSIHKLKRGGIYIIEDVSPKSLLLFADFLASQNFNYDFINLHRKKLSLGDNSLIVIRRD